MVRLIDGRNKDIQWIIRQMNRSSQLDFEEGRAVVEKILSDVKNRGDEAILEYSRRLDRAVFSAPEEMAVTRDEIARAYEKVSPRLVEILKKAKERIEKFHLKQKSNSWVSFEEDGTVLGQKIQPMERVGIYVPGGRAAYPSSVLMNAIPAKVAGVEEIIMVTPPKPDGSVNPNTLVAADIAGVDRIFRVGGAQAIAALAFGTATIPKADKIVGPGNIYVTLAKKEVYGYVDIDMIAGPSEVLVIADESAKPAYVAADLLSQAEHDPMASAILVTTSHELAERVKEEIAKQAAPMSTAGTIELSLSKNGALIVVDSLKDAVALANAIAPEHLEICTANPNELLGDIKHAGCIFLGEYSPEPVGDYMAGPNHVLPTSGTARYFSALGVDSFIKKSSIVSFTRAALEKMWREISDFAREEGLVAHANSVEVRFKEDVS